MKFQHPLLKGHLIKRYKRFLADVQLDSGEVITAHCPNSGSMLGLKDPGIEVALSQSDNPNRKLPYTLEMVKIEKTWVGVNTQWPNKLFQEGVQEKKFQEFCSYDQLQAEVRYGEKTRLDFLLTQKDKKCFVEVKNVTLKEDKKALFPDAVTSRGAKHLEVLMAALDEGYEAAVFFIVQRGDCSVFSSAKSIDPHYHHLLKQAIKKGVQCICYAYDVSPEGIFLKSSISIELDP